MIRFLYCKLTKQEFTFTAAAGMMDAGIDFLAVLFLCGIYWVLK